MLTHTCVHMYTHTCVHIHTYMYMYIHGCTHMHMHMHMHTHAHTHMHTQTQIYTCTYKPHRHIHVITYMFLSICLVVNSPINTYNSRLLMAISKIKKYFDKNNRPVFVYSEIQEYWASLCICTYSCSCIIISTCASLDVHIHRLICVTLQRPLYNCVWAWRYTKCQ